MSNLVNDIAWKKIFEEYYIMTKLEKSDHVIISAKNIGKIGGREPRLMTKFDHKLQLPKLFIDNQLSILPISRGKYIIGQFKTFHEFEKDDVSVKKINLLHSLESLDYLDITSEATAINCAFIFNIIHDFVARVNASKLDLF